MLSESYTTNSFDMKYQIIFNPSYYARMLESSPIVDREYFSPILGYSRMDEEAVDLLKVGESLLLEGGNQQVIRME